MKNDWPTEKSELIRLIIEFFVLTLLLLILAVILFPDAISAINLVVLTATLIVLVWYAYDTHRIANQTIEGNLRPLILRSGFIESWGNIKYSIKNGVLEGKPLEFSILKNIAKDISGYIIINKRKYQLLFANYISGKDVKNELSDTEKNVLMYLYDRYKDGKKNLPQKIITVYKSLGIKNGEYVGTVANSRYIETRGEDFLLTNDGIRLMDSDKPIEYRFEHNWGWMNAGTVINAIFTNDKYEESKEENQIYLTYSDMGGNRYFTRENINFSQDSGKL